MLKNRIQGQANHRKIPSIGPELIRNYQKPLKTQGKKTLDKHTILRHNSWEFASKNEGAHWEHRNFTSKERRREWQNGQCIAIISLWDSDVSIGHHFRHAVSQFVVFFTTFVSAVQLDEDLLINDEWDIIHNFSKQVSKWIAADFVGKRIQRLEIRCIFMLKFGDRQDRKRLNVLIYV